MRTAGASAVSASFCRSPGPPSPRGLRVLRPTTRRVWRTRAGPPTPRVRGADLAVDEGPGQGLLLGAGELAGQGNFQLGVQTAVGPLVGVGRGPEGLRGILRPGGHVAVLHLDELLRKAPLGIGTFPRDIVRVSEGTAPLAPTRMLDGQMINGHDASHPRTPDRCRTTGTTDCAQPCGSKTCRSPLPRHRATADTTPATAHRQASVGQGLG